MQCQKNFKYFTIWELQGTIVCVYTIDKIEECANASSFKKKNQTKTTVRATVESGKKYFKSYLMYANVCLDQEVPISLDFTW